MSFKLVEKFIKKIYNRPESFQDGGAYSSKSKSLKGKNKDLLLSENKNKDILPSKNKNSALLYGYIFLATIILILIKALIVQLTYNYIIPRLLKSCNSDKEPVLLTYVDSIALVFLVHGLFR